MGALPKGWRRGVINNIYIRICLRGGKVIGVCNTFRPFGGDSWVLSSGWLWVICRFSSNFCIKFFPRLQLIIEDTLHSAQCTNRTHTRSLHKKLVVDTVKWKRKGNQSLWCGYGVRWVKIIGTLFNVRRMHFVRIFYFSRQTCQTRHLQFVMCFLPAALFRISNSGFHDRKMFSFESIWVGLHGFNFEAIPSNHHQHQQHIKQNGKKWKTRKSTDRIIIKILCEIRLTTTTTL